MTRAVETQNYDCPVPRQSSSVSPANGAFIAGGESIFDGVTLGTTWVTGTSSAAVGSSTGSAALGTMAASTTRYLTGTGSTLLTTGSTNGDWSRFQLVSPDTGGRLLGVGRQYRASATVYIEDYSQISSIDIIFSLTHKLLDAASVPTNAIRYRYKIMEDSIGATNRFNGWHVISGPHSQWVSSGTWGATSVGKFVGIQINPIAGANSVPVWVDSIHSNIKSRPKCIIWADDGWQSWYDNGISYLDTLGLPCTMGVIHELVGTGVYMSNATLASTLAAGHEIVPHGAANLYSLGTAAAIYDEIKANRDYVVDNSLGNGYHYVYPGGYHELVTGSGDMVVRDALIALGIKSARGAVIGDALTSGLNYQHQGMGDRKWLSSVVGTSYTHTPATLLARLDLAIQGGMLFQIMFHQLLAAGAAAGDEYNTPDFQTFADGVLARKKLGLIDVVTASEWYNGLTYPRG